MSSKWNHKTWLARWNFSRKLTEFFGNGNFRSAHADELAPAEDRCTVAILQSWLENNAVKE